MYKTIVKIIVFAWVLTSAITWADETDETDETGGIVYMVEPGESFAGVPAVLPNYIDYSRYLSPYDHMEIDLQLSQATIMANLREEARSGETRRMSGNAYQALRQYIDYSKHLSPAAETDISRQLAKAEVAARFRDGTLFDEVAPAPEKTFKVLFLPQDQYEEMLILKASPQASSAPASVSGPLSGSVSDSFSDSFSGNVDCNSLDLQLPHLGNGPGNSRVPKAKSAGSCAFIPTGPGPSPPTLTFKLRQVLYLLDSYGETLPHDTSVYSWPPRISVASHIRHGLTVTWHDDKAQVFGACPIPEDPAYKGANYAYTHFVWISAPPGWVYVGANPLLIGPIKTNYFSC